ncbi:ABC transporter ATP-binding protein [Photobacterium atrarenae]|uniref:ABC transporter ATP-binding protein/permease n=1 Tax=Photobacterium atrarenae TaxID=865757 RepID=A0ABY5GL20_9GAMM|nr:ABC transporter ATP-binding protein [Photobacterium atrarenae]UTV29805.1 ABC transporter ATP-binding protein/permease [Photobacterium atrarenae]
MNRKQSIQDGWKIMSPVKGQIRFAMALSVLSSLSVLASLYALALAVEVMVDSNQAWPTVEIVAATFCTILAYVLRLRSFAVSHRAAFRLETILRTQLSEHLAKVSMGYIQQLGASRLSKVIQDDVKELHVFVADSTPLYARAYAAPIMTLIGLLVLDWRLAAATVGLLVGGFLVLGIARRDHGDLSKRYMETREQVSAAVIEYVQAMPVVRTFDTGSSTFGRYYEALEAYREIVVSWYRSVSFSSRFSIALLNPMPTLVLLLWAGVWLFWNHELEFSTWLATLLIGTGMAESMMPLISLQHLVGKAKISITRINHVLSEKPLLQPDKEHIPQGWDICFDNVSFRYTEDSGDVLRNVSFAVGEGTITALVGPSGAGKTTIARLLPRFWDVSEGKITIGGVDVRNLTSERLMQYVAFVFQDTFLFAQSIADNIRLGNPNATMEEIVEAAKFAQAHEFIMQLPNGYDTCAGERGTFLSGGQKQRITIARAILQNRPILVLDEATAFADPENEASIIEALAALVKGKTVLMVAHRLTTIKDADQILVFDKGSLVESGKHCALISDDGTYARLWRSYERSQAWTFNSESKTSSVGSRAFLPDEKKFVEAEAISVNLSVEDA